MVTRLAKLGETPREAEANRWSAMDGAQPAASEAVWMQRDRASHRTACIFEEVNARQVSPESGILEA